MKDGKNNLKSSMIMELTGEAAKKRQIQLPETTGEYGVGTAYLQLKDEKIATLREQVKKLEDDKKKLIIQLVDYEELKSENERLKKQLAKK